MLKGLIHTGLVTQDLESSISFFKKAFDCKIIFKEKNICKEIESITGIKNQKCSLAQLSVPTTGHLIELLQFHGFESNKILDPNIPLRPGQGHIAFLVENFDLWVEKLTALKAKIIGKVTKFPEGRAVYFLEPNGIFIEISESQIPKIKNE